MKKKVLTKYGLFICACFFAQGIFGQLELREVAGTGGLVNGDTVYSYGGYT